MIRLQQSFEIGEIGVGCQSRRSGLLWVSGGHFKRPRPISACTLRADIGWTRREIRFAPEGDVAALSNHVVGPRFTDGFAFLTFQKNGGAFLRLSAFCHNSWHSIGGGHRGDGGHDHFRLHRNRRSDRLGRFRRRYTFWRQVQVM